VFNRRKVNTNKINYICKTFITMIKKYYLFIGLLLVMKIEISFSQLPCILAGDNILPHYTDLVPDDTVTENQSQGSHLIYGAENLDINNDGIVDFVININQYNSPMAMGSNSGIGSANATNKVLVNTVNKAIPDTLHINDSICNTAIWKSGGRFIDAFSEFDSAGVHYDSSEWRGLTNKYIGLKLVNSVDSTFGWVQVSVSSNSVIIKDYGCGNIAPEPPAPPNSSGIITYPNPTDEFINIYLPTYSYYELKLYNDTGELIYDNAGHDYKIDVSLLPSGIYFLRIITNDKTINQKIIVKRKDK
jgi:Secretion system C-terminal sorting domain